MITSVEINEKHFPR